MVNSIDKIDGEIAGLKEELLDVKGEKTEVYQRIVGYFRNVPNWNAGKAEEYKERLEYALPEGAKA